MSAWISLTSVNDVDKVLVQVAQIGTITPLIPTVSGAQSEIYVGGALFRVREDVSAIFQKIGIPVPAF